MTAWNEHELDKIAASELSGRLNLASSARQLFRLAEGFLGRA